MRPVRHLDGAQGGGPFHGVVPAPYQLHLQGVPALWSLSGQHQRVGVPQYLAGDPEMGGIGAAHRRILLLDSEGSQLLLQLDSDHVILAHILFGPPV